ncbi:MULTISPECIES: ABC-three component system protein [Pseudomonas]|uniref:ABC-three component systems C-terminal domain-containing protein n=1 Tax=Pseudomonas piscis TaxID=2614538 RepID=A0A7X1U4J7_9PSED|nr:MULTISPECIES: ABC-three component system protein [Pseudomonas]MDN5426755.1 hypothetical protein [Pseudomonadales bacterium]MQA54239.1 hypothetical protein [Pseudomonas piscis]MQT99993.1 hypothetical protein [Pseudomonas sp. FSL R10-2245]WEJ24082.1 hypothetical protein N0B28_12640 [Pseudomonas sp. SD17-1]
MIKRFRLEQKGRYEKLVIARRLSDMLDKYLDGRPAPMFIGAEQGGIPQWDDVVVQHTEEHWEHLQIKRQTTCFSDKHVDKEAFLQSREKKAKGDKAGEGSKPSDPVDDADVAVDTDAAKDPADDQFDSELEKVMKSLASWQAPASGAKPSKRTFTLHLPGLDVAIKGHSKAHITTINHLREFWDSCNKDGLSVGDLSQRDDNPTQRVYTWLTTWCGFRDWSHVVEKMQMLSIESLGDETELETAALASLDRHFLNSRTTLSLLIDYISDNTTDTNVISCYSAAKQLQNMLRPSFQTWTQYLLNPLGQDWTVTGTHDLDGPDTGGSVNPASQVVSHHWKEGAFNRQLRLHAGYRSPSPGVTALPSAILRLALHLKAGSHGLLLGEPVWRQGVDQELGSTLGIGEADLDDLPWIQNTESLSCGLGRPITSQLDNRRESAALHDAMNEVVWQQLQNRVEQKMAKITDLDLLTAMEAMWREWKPELSADQTARQSLFEQLMYPQTEGLDAKHALRIGPRTLELLEVAILMLMLTCVGLGGADAHWRAIPPIGDILSIALRHWSGGATDRGGPRLISEDSLRVVLGQSPAPVVVLSGVEASATCLRDSGMADDRAAEHSMAAERQPRLLITRFQVYSQLQRGTLTSLQEYFKKQWNEWLIERDAAINACGKGQ